MVGVSCLGLGIGFQAAFWLSDGIRGSLKTGNRVFQAAFQTIFSNTKSGISNKKGAKTPHKHYGSPTHQENKPLHNWQNNTDAADKPSCAI